MANTEIAVRVYDWCATKSKGQTFPNPDPSYFQVESPIPFWGLVTSMRFYVYRDGQPAQDVNHYDWGVKFYKDHLVLSMQFQDKMHTPSVAHEYVVRANIEFGELTIGAPAITVCPQFAMAT